ncbi:WD40 repeat domain-containing protein [Streptomyces sp. NPDC059718]
MNVDELVRASLREQAAEQPALGPGFAERVLAVRRRRRTRALASVAAATAVVVAVAVAVPFLDAGKDDARLANVSAHPDQTPPRDMIAAGGVALAAYYTWETDARGVAVRAYRLLDPKTGTYVKTTTWSRVAVAPGMRTAAVLERNLPAKRIGLLDLRTGEVERWIPVDRGVAGVEFSPDGSKLVVTTYSENPDLRYKKAKYDNDGDGEKDWTLEPDAPGQSSRTGFYILDVASGKGSWSEAAVDQLGIRQDFAFSRDGKLLQSGLFRPPYRQYYDFAGNQVAAPANEAYASWRNESGLSPDGKFVGGGYLRGTRPIEQSRSKLLDPYTGKQVTTVRGEELLTWVDNKHLIAWDFTSDLKSHSLRLVLVTIGSDKVVPLSGFSKGLDGAAGHWTPIFAER